MWIGSKALYQRDDRLKGLVSEDLRIHELDRDSIELDQLAIVFLVGYRNHHPLVAETLDEFFH